MTVVAIILTAGFSLWTVSQERAGANAEIAQAHSQFQTELINKKLQALSHGISDIAGNPIVARALIDGDRRKSYLEPFLRSHNRIEDTEVQVLLSDSAGRIIGHNGVGSFPDKDTDWLRQQLAAGMDIAMVREDADGPALLGIEILRNAETRSLEGALFYKLRLADLQPGPKSTLRWGGSMTEVNEHSSALQAPPRFQALGFAVHVDATPIASGIEPHLFLWIIGIATLAGVGFFMLASRLAYRMTKDLRHLETFARSVSLEGIGNQRALPGRSTEVSSLAESINRMLDKLHEQHAALRAEQEKFFLMANTIPQLAWMANARGDVQWMNDRWHAYAGTSPLEPYASSAWHAIVDPDMLPELQMRWKRALQKIAMDEFTVRMRATDGSFRNFHTTIAPLRDQEGNVTHWVGSHTDVTEIARAKQEAETAARAKSDFLATMSHEIRTHLNIVIGSTELARRAPSQVKMSELLGNILQSSNRLLNVVESIPGLSSRDIDGQESPSIHLPPSSELPSTHQSRVETTLMEARYASSWPPFADLVPALTGIRVLLAEDNRFNQELAQELLEKAGATVLIAENGREALLYLERSRFDCVLMDMQMPEMDGLEASRRIRRHPEWNNLPIIAMTANAGAQQRLRCKEAGMSDFVTKPFSPDTLFKTILRHVRVQPSVSPSQKSATAESQLAQYPDLAGLNLNVLASIVGNDPQKLRRLVSSFVDTTEEAIVELNAGVAQKDLIQLAQIGHRYKSSAQAVGATELGGLFVALEELHEIEEIVRKSDGGIEDQAAVLMADVAAQFAMVRQAVAEWLECTEANNGSSPAELAGSEWTTGGKHD